MSFYTVELRKIAAWPTLNQVLAEYPIHNETNRRALNELFLKRYWFRDIGYETGEMFVQRLDFKLSEIMPFYNEVFKSTEVEYDMLTNTDLTTLGDSDSTSNSTGSSTNESNQSTVGTSETVSDQFDMPQTQLDQNGDYLTSRGMSQGRSESTGAQTGEDSRTDESRARQESTQSTRGRSGVSGAQLVLDYRSAILNVNQLIVDDLSVLFMHVYRPINRSH